jgi:hypothetical protein
MKDNEVAKIRHQGRDEVEALLRVERRDPIPVFSRRMFTIVGDTLYIKCIKQLVRMGIV